MDAGRPCRVQLKIATLADKTIWLMTTDQVQHGLEIKPKKRKNSRLTFEARADPMGLCAHTHAHARTQTCTCLQARMHMHTHTHMHVSTCTHAHARTDRVCTHTWMCMQ